MPKYSADLNDIEHDFSALKRAIMYSHINTSLDKIFVIIVLNNVSFLLKKNYKTKSNKFCRKWWYDYQSGSYIWDGKSFDI